MIVYYFLIHFFTSLLTKNYNIIYNIIKYYEVFCSFLVVLLRRLFPHHIRFIKEPRYFSIAIYILYNRTCGRIYD